MRCWMLAALMFAGLGTLEAQTAKIESPTAKVGLLELYTSEGCSSCPPADRWLSSLKEDERLWRTLVPVAFHVDYWDYIGWKDRFALPVYGERQRRYARAGHSRSVYTPGFIFDGAEWRAWFRSRRIPELPPGDVGVLAVEVEEGRMHATFEPVSADYPSELLLHVTLLGFDIESEIEAGENRGRKLHHDFVVLAYGSMAIVDGDAGYSVEMPLPDVAQGKQTALAVWVTEHDQMRPIQSAGGWLD